VRVPAPRYRRAVATAVVGIVVAFATGACGGADEEPPGRFDPGAEPADTPEEFEPFDEEGG
jgi:hypothetical protein